MRWIALELGGAADLTGLQPTFEPAELVHALRLGKDRTLHVQVSGSPLVARIPGYCPVHVPGGGTQRVVARPLIELPASLSQVGFDSRARIEVAAGCEAARAGTIRWYQLEGASVSLDASDRGFVLQLKTGAAPRSLGQQTRHGLVPVSAAQQGRAVLEARYRGPAGEAFARRVLVTALARATGLPTVPVGQRMLLAGAGFRVTARPRGSRAEVVSEARGSSFTADRTGRYELQDLDGCHVTLQAGRHNEVPYDCARGPCHAALNQHASTSPMSHALSNLPIDGRGASGGCVPDCHYTGEAGLADGGFVATARALGFRPSQPVPVAQLPASLARFAGVRCTDCHGPAAIPPEHDRALILAPDVCATCHDDPPRLPLLERFRSGRMARSDASPATRTGACAGCHTTGGFLARVGVRAQDAGEPGPIGIACAACHAAHGDHRARLLRALPAPPSLQRGSEADPELARLSPCGHCHAPLTDEALPSASAAALLLGRVVLPERLGGDLVQGPQIRAHVAGGCTGCHGTADLDSGRIDHAFTVDTDACRGCHTPPQVVTGRSAMAPMQQTARALLDELSLRCRLPSDDLAHATTPAMACEDDRLERARYLATLVLRDRAAAVHNPDFARVLLTQVAELVRAPAAARP